MKRLNQGQSVAEYFITLVVILAAVLASGFISRLNSRQAGNEGGFVRYFNQAVQHIPGTGPLPQ